MKLIRSIIFIIFVTGLGIKTAAGQSLSYIGIEQGLSNNTVTAIHKDKFGLMWFGTLDGLNRYDGYTFKIFRNKYNDSTSLPNDIITTITSDKAGDIWVGTQKGLGILNSKTLQFSGIYYKSGSDKRTRFDKWVYAINSDYRGNIYIGCADGGLLICNNGLKEAFQVPLINLQRKRILKYTVTAIAVHNQNEMWLVADNIGLCSYNLKTKSLTALTNSIPTTSSIKPDYLGNLWIGTNHGIYYYNVKLNKLNKFDIKDPALSDINVSDILIDKRKQLWISTNGEGVLQLAEDGNNEYHVIKSIGSGTLSSDAIFTIYEDKLSRKWIGTLRGGIDIIDEKKNQFKTYVHNPVNANSLINNFTFSFCEDNDKNIWIGTDGGGLSVWNRKKNKFENHVFESKDIGGVNSNRIPSIIKDGKQNMWVASWGGGVRRFNKGGNLFDVVPLVQNTGRSSSVWKLYADQKDNIWATCLRGFTSQNEKNRLFKYDYGKKYFVSAPFAVNEDIIAITDDDAQNLWMGGFTGLLHANKITGINKVIDLKTPVRALYKSKSGKLWLGTYGRGLMSYDASTGQFKNYTEENGLCNNKVLNIEEDKKGNIWVSTNNGISKLNPLTGKIESFYAADGLQSNQFYFNASAHLSSGELMFGGIEGFNIFNPDSIRQFHDFPPLIIAGLRIANTNITADNEFLPGAKSFYTIDHIRLPYDKAIISLDYGALEYSLPEKIQYAYLLQGRDKSWNYVGNQRTVNYSHLNEGDYTLKIKSTNASGIWNPDERLIYITVIPPWYRSWWAYIFYVLSLGSIAYTYYLYKTRQTKLKYEVAMAGINMEKEKAERAKEQAEKEKIGTELDLERAEHEKERMLNEKEKELNEKRLSFFTNISHEFRTPLTLIINPAKVLLEKEETANIRPESEVNVIYRNARRMLSLVDQLLHFRKVDTSAEKIFLDRINFYRLCQEVYLCFSQQANSRHIKYEFICENKSLELYADRAKMEIILYNLISNALKYTPPEGSVCFSITEDDEKVFVKVADTGTGIRKEEGDQIFEKFYQSEDSFGKVKPGFGIGLYLVKYFAEIHHGKIAYSSEPGATVFILTLLKGKEHFCDININNTELLNDTPENNEEASFMYAAVDEDAAGGNLIPANPFDGELFSERKTVLIADDDTDMRLYIVELFSKDFNTYEASSGEEGLKLAKQYLPDIIISDIKMQGISGIDLCKEIKNDQSTAHIPVILLTGTSSLELKLEGVEGGADDYITKPFEKEYLMARVKTLLKSRNSLQNYFYNKITNNNSDTIKVSAEYKEFIEKCISIVEKYIDDSDFNVTTLLQEIGMSHSNLYRKVKSVSGVSITVFIRLIRLRKAAELMIRHNYNVNEISAMVGFNSPNYFRTQFQKLFGMKPSVYIKNYRNSFGDEYIMNNINFDRGNK